MGVWVAAPSAGALLADWGADVIKVEPPNGDPMRSAFGSLGIGTGLPEPRLRAGQPGEAQRRARPARAGVPGAARGAAVDGRRLPDQPAARRARRPRARAGGHGRPPSAPRLLQRQRVRPAGGGPEPPGLRHRRLLGPVRPVRAAGQQRGGAAQRPRRHRGPHQRAGRPGRPPGRGARAAPDRTRARRRGVTAEDRDLRARVGPQPPGERRQGGQGRGAARQPDAADEFLPDEGRALVLLHRPGGGPAHRHRVPRPRPAGPAGRPPLRRRQGSPQEPHGGHRRPRRHRRARGPSTSGPSASTARASGGHRPKGRRTCWRTPSSPPTTGSSSCATRPTGRRGGRSTVR